LIKFIIDFSVSLKEIGSTFPYTHYKINLL
jgi:hypothetical protein